MVDESLVFHFASVVSETKLRRLLSDHLDNPCTESETQKLIAAIEKTRILDPACGSGAFPMGVLHRLVYCKCQSKHTVDRLIRSQPDFTT